MNQTHLHLLLNHLPIFGSILGGLVLAYGLRTRSVQTQIAAYGLFIISSIASVITYLTGEAAEEAVENIQGISKNMLDLHEDVALASFVALIILGVASIAGLILAVNKTTVSRKFAMATLFMSIVSFILVARTGYTGGLIRHTEINSSGSTQMQSSDEKGDD